MAAKKKKAPAKRAAKKAATRPNKARAAEARATAPEPAEEGSVAARALVRALGKKFDGRVLTVSDDRKANASITEFISSGVEVLDNYVIGRGGFPVGRMCEIFGEEGCGKTALALHALAQVQRAGGVGVLADAEHAFDEERAEAFGINMSDLVLLQPENLEEFFEMAKGVLRTHKPAWGPMLFAWDSIAVTRTKHGLVQEAGDKKVADVPLMLSEELPKILQLLPQHRAHFMMLNQIRHKIGVMFGSNITTPGGNAPKFYSSLRLQFFGGKAVKKNDEHIAKVVTIMAVKNRLRAPFAKARVRFDYATGYNNIYSTVEHAKSLGLVKPREGKSGFNGKGKEGQRAYEEAIARLGWGAVGAPERGLRLGAGVEADGEEIEFEVSDE